MTTNMKSISMIMDIVMTTITTTITIIIMITVMDIVTIMIMTTIMDTLTDTAIMTTITMMQKHITTTPTLIATPIHMTKRDIHIVEVILTHTKNLESQLRESQLQIALIVDHTVPPLPMTSMTTAATIS